MLEIPGYRLGEKLYDSPKTVVFGAVRLADGMRVVVKTNAMTHPSPRQLARLRREVHLVRDLRIDGIAKPVDIFEIEGRPVAVYEDFGGRSLMHLFVTRVFDLRTQLELAHRIASVLAEVHTAGIIHKDISPGNIVWNPETNECQLIDFGIATRLRHEAVGALDTAVEGTLSYMAPEQTGRMNRSIDSRSDLYAFGATMFHFFAGRPPFVEDDQLELMHSHVARPAPKLHTLVPRVPEAVSAILDRLLAKNAEDRYQSAGALAADLEFALTSLRTTGSIALFPLRTGIGHTLRIPERLYGRAREIESLLAAYQRTVTGGREMLLVSGFSGIGKTRLVMEIHKPIIETRGLFVAGKFDQYQRNIPYSSLIQAFRELLRSILTLSEDRVTGFRTVLADALGTNGQVIADVIPEVTLLLGAQPPVAELPPLESRNRFHFLFERFFRAFARKEHPFVLFLDDLQWADRATLELLTRLFVSGQTAHLLVIGAYRDDEVGDEHILRPMLKELAEQGQVVHTIALAPLSRADVDDLLADALAGSTKSAESVVELASVLHERTEGNPFVLTRFLAHLHDEKLISFDADHEGWRWDLDAIRRAALGEGAEALLVRRMLGLPEPTIEVLRIAACLGNTFDLETLRLVSEKPVRALVDTLWPAVEADLVIPLGDEYTLLAHGAETAAAGARFRFVHDRVQQAAWGLSPGPERSRIHSRVGRMLLEKLDASTRESRLFEIVQHLEYGYDGTSVAREELVGLCLLAGRRARAAAAYEPALRFAERALELLDESSPEAAPELTLDLRALAASAAYSNGEFDRMDDHVDAVLEHTQDTRRRAEVFEIRLSSLIARNRPAAAVDLALEVLPEYRVVLPRSPTDAEIGAALTSLIGELGSRNITDLAAAPDMTNATALGAMSILTSIASAAYVAAPALFPLVAIEQAKLSFRHGVTASSAFAMSVLGILFASPVGDLDAAFACATTAEQILDRVGPASIEGRARYVATVYLRIWKKPVNEIWSLCPAIERRCLETGDLEFAAWAAMMRVKHALFSGHSLLEAEPEARRSIDNIAHLKQGTALNYTRMTVQAMRNLAGRSRETHELVGDAYDVTAMLPVHEEQADAFAIASVHFYRMVLRYLFGQYELALESEREVAARLGTFAGLFYVPLYHQYAALTRLALAAQLSGEARDELCREADASLERLLFFAMHHAGNHAHRVALVEAERAVVDGRRGDAIDAFERAAKHASTEQFLLDLGLCHERASYAWARWGNATIARAYAAESRFAYMQYGANALVRRIDDRWGRSAFAHGSQIIDTRMSASFTTTTESVDFRSVLKASQAISGELTTDRLLGKLMKISLESGGAERGSLVIVGERGPHVEARAFASGACDVVNVPLADSDDVSVEIVRYVLRAGENVALGNASIDARWKDSPYVLARGCRSLLCVPIVRSGTVVGAIHLENATIPDAFDEKRIEVLQVIASQAAISLENARLVEDLEERVAERTKQLEVRNGFIRDVFGRYVSNEVVDELLENSTAVKPGGELRRVTILMADLRGFSIISQNREPSEIVRLLNNHLEVMIELVHRHGGTVDEVLGDAILVLFGAPLARPDHAEAAVRCALAMQLAMDRVNAQNLEQGLPTVEMGVGICTGEVVVGSIGSQLRAKYGVVGTAVNLAARIEEMTVGGQILAAESTIEAIPAKVEVDAEHRVVPKGLSEPIRVLSVVAIDGPNGASLPRYDGVKVALEAPLDVEVARMSGKHDASEAHRARVTHLAPREAWLTLVDGAPLADLTDVRFRLRGIQSNAYGKVVSHDGPSVHIRFTSVPEALRRLVDELTRPPR